MKYRILISKVRKSNHNGRCGSRLMVCEVRQINQLTQLSGCLNIQIKLSAYTSKNCLGFRLVVHNYQVRLIFVLQEPQSHDLLYIISASAPSSIFYLHCPQVFRLSSQPKFKCYLNFLMAKSINLKVIKANYLLNIQVEHFLVT